MEDIFRREDPILLAIPEYISEKVWGEILTHTFTIKIRVLKIFYTIISAKVGIPLRNKSAKVGIPP